MKKIFFALCVLVSLGVSAQKFRGIDKSPMDMAYYPDDFAHDRKFAPEKVGDVCYLRLLYSRPAKKDRQVFGNMVKYNEVWRLGANEEPELKVYKDIKVNGQKLKAGTYTLFAIPDVIIKSKMC
jgi:hypothetical protein